MKNIPLILLLLFISCKNETKPKVQNEKVVDTENGIDPSVYALWNSYIASNPESKGEDLPESDFFHNTKKDADRLAQLTLEGKKKASSGVYSLYKQFHVDLPKVGTKQIITDFDGKAHAIIENKSVDTIPFNAISKDYAVWDMGTDIEPLKKWKKAHWDFFRKVLQENGGQPTEDMMVVCVTFETIWPKKH